MPRIRIRQERFDIPLPNGKSHARVLAAANNAGFVNIRADERRIRADYDRGGIQGDITVRLSPLDEDRTIVHIASNAHATTLRGSLKDVNDTLHQALKRQL